MGIKEKFKNLWAYQPPSTDTLKQPLDGGNNFQVQQEFLARMNNLLSSIDTGNMNIDNVVYDEYFLMLFQKNYFVNLFDIETEDNDFKRVWNIFVELCFWFGEAAIINNGIEGVDNGTNLIPVYIKNKSYTPIGNIEKDFEYYLGAPILPMVGDTKFNFKNSDTWKLKSFKNKGDFVYGKWNSQGYGCWVWMYKFIKFQRELMFLTHNSAYLQKEIMFYKVNNKSVVNNEIKQLYNPKSNIVYEMGVNWEGDGKMENRWNVETPSNDKSMLINEVYDWHIQKYYELFGRRNNIDFKKERNITDEVNASQQQFDILINETRKFMEISLNELKTKFGKEGKFLIDIKNEKENEFYEEIEDKDFSKDRSDIRQNPKQGKDNSR